MKSMTGIQCDIDVIHDAQRGIEETFGFKKPNLGPHITLNPPTTNHEVMRGRAAAMQKVVNGIGPFEAVIAGFGHFYGNVVYARIARTHDVCLFHSVLIRRMREAGISPTNTELNWQPHITLSKEYKSLGGDHTEILHYLNENHTGIIGQVVPVFEVCMFYKEDGGEWKTAEEAWRLEI